MKLEGEGGGEKGLRVKERRGQEGMRERRGYEGVRGLWIQGDM